MKTQDIKNIGQAWMQVQENSKQALAKKLAKASAPSEKGKAAVTLPKAPFEIPEDIPANERTAFHGAAAAAHKAGKSHFTMNGKKYPVTMKKDAAKAIADDVQEAKVDEISKDLAGRYIKKAQISTADAGRDTMDDDPNRRAKGINKIVNRRHGTVDAVSKLTGKARVPATEEVELDEVSISKMQKYAKAASKDIENKRNTVSKAMSTGKASDYDDAQKAVKGLTRRSKGSDMYTDKMTGRSKVKPTTEQDEVKLCPNCDGSMENHSPDCKMVNKASGNETAEANPKMKESKKWPIYSRIMEKKDAHTKGAIPAQDIDDEASKKEKEFTNQHGGLDGNKSEIDGEKAAAETAKNIANSVKQAPKRPADKTDGDKKAPKQGA